MHITSSTAGSITVAHPTTEIDVEGPAISSDFETFLKMLTVQMQNQDPLNPIESSDYAVQLATFSGVEQQVRTNDLLKSMVGQFGMMGMSQLSGWVGMEAKVAAPTFFDGTPINLYPTLANNADQAFLVVRDERHAEIQRMAVDPSQETVTWAGVGDAGDPLPTGNYSFHIESLADGQVIEEALAEAYSVVTEARNDSGNVTLILEGGAEVEASLVHGLRQPAE